jgi:hypothetical protein
VRGFLLFLSAYWTLTSFEHPFAKGSFENVYERVRHSVLARHTANADAVRKVCSAINWASIWYWKEVLCLQRSAATVCLLRKHGVPAQLVIGARRVPFAAHAWVEVEGQIVNDKPSLSEIYMVLDRC